MERKTTRFFVGGAEFETSTVVLGSGLAGGRFQKRLETKETRRGKNRWELCVERASFSADSGTHQRDNHHARVLRDECDRAANEHAVEHEMHVCVGPHIVRWPESTKWGG